MGGCLVAWLPHLGWRSGPGRHPLLLLPQGDAQGEARASLPAKGLGSFRPTCQQGKPPPCQTLTQAPTPTHLSSCITFNSILLGTARHSFQSHLHRALLHSPAFLHGASSLPLPQLRGSRARAGSDPLKVTRPIRTPLQPEPKACLNPLPLL